MTTIRKNIQSALLVTLLASSLSGAWAQQTATPASAAAQAAPAAGLVPAVAMEGDSIDVRAKRAAELEEARVRSEQIKLNPALATLNSPQPKALKMVVPRPEFYLEAIRGFDDSLEAALVINGKRVTGSKSYPTLTEGWVISAISDHGVTISNTKGKTRQSQSLAFVGPEPYLPVMADIQGANLSATPAAGGAMPAGRPMPMPVGR